MRALLAVALVGLLVLLWLQRSQRKRPGTGIAEATNIHPADQPVTITVGGPARYTSHLRLPPGHLGEVTVGFQRYTERDCSIEYWINDGPRRHLMAQMGQRPILPGHAWPTHQDDVLHVAVTAEAGDRVDLSRGQLVICAQVR